MLGNAQTDSYGSCCCCVESEAGEFFGGGVGVDSDRVEGDQFASSTEEESSKPEFICFLNSFWETYSS